MKAFKLMMMAGMMAFATAASAQGTITCLTAEDVSFEGAKANLVVNMDYETTYDIVSWGFSLYLPDGVAVAGEEELGEFYADNATLGTDTNARAIISNGIKLKVKEDGGMMVLGYSMSNAPMKSTHGMLCTIELSGSKDINGNGTLKDISVATVGESGDAISLDQGKLAEVTFKVNDGGSAVGINDINAAETSAPAYNLQGVRVNGNAKGLIIRDGKKMVVK